MKQDAAELLADTIVHVIGVALGIAGALWLVLHLPDTVSSAEWLAVMIYAAGLLAMLTASALYNIIDPTPISLRGWLRRIDHSAIYVLIAATYTPFITQIRSGSTPSILLVAIWSIALIGVLLKLALPGRLDRLSIAVYLALGWSGVVAYDELFGALDPQAAWLLATGGIIYSLGVVFHVWETLPFHNAIWHLFVLVAAICHYFAVLSLF